MVAVFCEAASFYLKPVLLSKIVVDHNFVPAVVNSPSVSFNAFLHSIMPAFVLSRSSFTKEAVISAMVIRSFIFSR